VVKRKTNAKTGVLRKKGQKKLKRWTDAALMVALSFDELKNY